jgi:RimJ/RimL family protein N-acetyltransferase
MTRVPELRRDGLLLRPWRDEDAPAVLELAQDAQSRAWMASLRRVQDLPGALAWIAERRGDDRLDWAVCDPTTGDLAARVGLHHFDERSRSVEIGYAVWPAHRRQGVAARAVGAATCHGFDALGLARVSLRHASANTASCRVAAATGYAFEGLERAAWDHGDGVLHDLHRHARLSTDLPGPAPLPPQPLHPMALEGDGLRLRPWESADATVVLQALSDPLTVRWNPRLPLADLDAARSWLSGRAQRWADGSAATWAVVEAGEVVGSVALRDLNHVDAFATASYWTMPAARGRGVAVRALARATAYAFDSLGLHRVQLAHVVANTASCRVAEKAGFPIEGRLRGSNRLAEGYADEHLHARLATDPSTGTG